MTSYSSSNNPEINPSDEKIVLENHLDELERLSDWLVEVAKRHELSQRLLFYLELVIAEAVTNVIQNAFTDDEAHKIPLWLGFENDAVVIEIRDDGLLFDPLQYPEAEMPQSLEDATEGGLGIHLIRSYCRECVYRREGNENILTLILDRVD